MERLINHYFHNLFQTSHPSVEDIDKILETIPSSITDAQNTLLIRSFTRQEIFDVIKSMNPTKAPGPDGIYAIFYQKYWDIVGEDTCNICLQILNEGTSMTQINKTHITLIPKMKDPKSMKDFHPISLCNVIYKLIAKTLANRSKSVLDQIISPSQFAFVPGRLITDNVIIGFECIHAVKSKV